MKYIVTCTCGLLLAALIYAQEPSPNQMEVLYGLTTTPASLLVDVKSRGCTNANDFHITRYPTPDGFEVVILRQQPDRCRKREKIISLRLALDPMDKNAHLRVLNPIQLRP